MSGLEIPDGAPIWVLVMLLILNLFREPISSFMSSSFPKLVDGFFSSRAKKKASDSDFYKQKELEILRNELKNAEAERANTDMLYKQVIERERTSITIIDAQFSFLQKLVESRLIEAEATIIAEILSLKSSFDHLRSSIIDKQEKQNNKPPLDHE